MIDPIHSLSFSIQGNPGVYALVLGSGVSRSAGIPTGWEITLDLIRKLAGLCGESCEPDPESWYRDKFGQEPDYSDLLDQIAKTPAERQQLLRTYLEPSEQEREEGLKQPTAAHRAIAGMVARGYFKVIITTNFDRLLETAISDAGVTPTVLSSPDQVKGSLPLIHTQCCVFKVHGDYLDTRIRNTPDELGEYPEEFNERLDRIFDEFGLVVCGWSADWDDAMREAIFRAPSRRFTTYWAVRGEASDKAQQLITHRQAQVMSIGDADSFFQAVHENVKSLQEFSRPHPLSTEAAVGSMKRYLAESRYDIQLNDLIQETVERVVQETSGPTFAVDQTMPVNSETLTARVRSYEAVCHTLMSIGAVGGRWAQDNHYGFWRTALQRLSEAPNVYGDVVWLNLRYYPGTLLMYALGLGAVESGRLRFLGSLFSTEVRDQHNQTQPILRLLSPYGLFEVAKRMQSYNFPISGWIHNVLPHRTLRIIPSEDQYTFMFDKLEILMSLSLGYYNSNQYGEYLPFLGPFFYGVQNRRQVINEIRESISNLGPDSPFVQAKIFGNSADICHAQLSSFETYLSTFPRYRP